MEKIKRFVECLIPVTACNLKCSYCYVIQRDNRKGKLAELKYTPEEIGAALSKDRWGGVCYFSICGAGETTLQSGIEDIVYQILKQGHLVNITTNGTVSKKIADILDKAEPYIDRLHFSFSFHYLELKRRKLTEKFFENIRAVREAGASYVVQFNMCDEYLPYLKEMKELCERYTGAAPQIAATRRELEGLEKIELLTDYSEEEYKAFGDDFHSGLFDFTMLNFNVKRKEFCYAGDWTAILDLSTGIMRRCYSSYLYQDVFKNPNEKIRFLAMGNCCGSPFCMNSSHFMTLGVIPDIQTPTYAELRNRDEASWYMPAMKNYLSCKLVESNKRYNPIKRLYSNLIGLVDGMIRKTYRLYKKTRGNNAIKKNFANGNKSGD